MVLLRLPPPLLQLLPLPLPPPPPPPPLLLLLLPLPLPLLLLLPPPPLLLLLSIISVTLLLHYYHDQLLLRRTLEAGLAFATTITPTPTITVLETAAPWRRGCRGKTFPTRAAAPESWPPPSAARCCRLRPAGHGRIREHTVFRRLTRALLAQASCIHARTRRPRSRPVARTGAFHHAHRIVVVAAARGVGHGAVEQGDGRHLLRRLLSRLAHHRVRAAVEQVDHLPAL